MKTKAFLLSAGCSFLAVPAVVGLLFTGCESASDANALSVHPTRVALAGAVYYQEFIASGPINASTNTSTVSTPESGSTTTPLSPADSEPQTESSSTYGDLRPLALPLTWSVSNPALGSVIESAGRRAVYVRSAGTGMNIVTCRDQYGSEGFAVVDQR